MQDYYGDNSKNVLIHKFKLVLEGSITSGEYERAWRLWELYDNGISDLLFGCYIDN
jgi:hypothetical protein